MKNRLLSLKDRNYMNKIIYTYRTYSLHELLNSCRIYVYAHYGVFKFD